jgi:hypothetical protein
LPLCPIRHTSSDSCQRLTMYLANTRFADP